LSKRDKSDLHTPELDESLTSQSADKKLMKRAKAILVERASPNMHLADALAIAKAENTELTKSASI